mgnify:CR=1 FL=1
MKDKSLKEKIIIIIISALLISMMILAIINYSSIVEFIERVVSIAVPFIYGGCTAYLLTPLCNKIEDKLKNKKVKHSDKFAIAITEIMFIALVIIICITIIPQSIKSISDIIKTLPNTWETFQETVQGVSGKHSFISELIGGDIKEINKFVTDFIDNTITPNINNIVASVAVSVASIGKTILNMIIGVIVSIFVLANRKSFARHSKIILRALLNKKTYNMVIEEVKIADKMFSGFFMGKIIDSLIVGIICFISLEIMRMPYAILVSVIVAITNVIPIVGPFIGAIPGAIIVFSADPLKALYFIVFIIILQQIDGHIIGPKCIGSATGLSTFWVLFAIIFFGGLWGIVGMLIGVPLLAVIFDIGNKVIKYILNKKNIETSSIK